jgi:predicted DNA-binding transcriptional regulator YafY
VLSVVEDAARAKQALQMAYVTTRTGEQSARLVSVQRVSYGARIRFVAYCHRSHRLKWFRVSNVRWAKADGSTPYQAAPVEEVDALFARSIDGYADRGPPRRVSFVVTGDAARWVPGNLPSTAMTAEPCPEGVRVSVETAGMDVLARFVVGLGAEVILETPELARRVADLARGALRRVAMRSVVWAVPRVGERGGAERAVGGRGGRLSAGRSG